MHPNAPDGSKFNSVCTDFPNLAVFTKISIPRDIQLMYVHASVRNKSLGKTVTAFALAGSL